jgi:hypothetical protein
VDGAVWGAVGAVAGAGLTALGGYLGPVRAARAAADERAQERSEQREQGEIERLIALRAAYREWEDYLARGHGGDSADVAREKLLALRRTAWRASDAVMRDRWWVWSQPKGYTQASETLVAMLRGEAGEAALRDAVARVGRSREIFNEQILGRLEDLTQGTLQVTREE